jgi:predicted GNAT superfamily acetyltransferase
LQHTEAVLRDVQPADLPGVLALNDAAVPHVNRITLDDLAGFADTAEYFRVAAMGERVAGFLVALTPDAEYHSPNFLWFRERYPSFVYVDRIVVSADARGGGVGSLLYDDLASHTRPLAPMITCEVNIRPPNDGSLAFHARHGFEPVGEQDTEGGAKRVRLFVRHL